MTFNYCILWCENPANSHEPEFQWEETVVQFSLTLAYVHLQDSRSHIVFKKWRLPADVQEPLLFLRAFAVFFLASHILQIFSSCEHWTFGKKITSTTNLSQNKHSPQQFYSLRHVVTNITAAWRARSCSQLQNMILVQELVKWQQRWVMCVRSHSSFWWSSLGTCHEITLRVFSVGTRDPVSLGHLFPTQRLC